MGAKAGFGWSRVPRVGIAATLSLILLGWMATDRTRGPARGPDGTQAGLAEERTGADAYPLKRANPGDSAGAAAERGSLERKKKELEARLTSLKPRGTYVVVDRGNNRIFLRRGDSLLVDAPVSTGSGAILREMGGQERTWTFDTPPGRFSILSEREDPVWTKPDWAFLEEGLPIPSRISDRRDPGALGEYALDLGDGYMIHGTLYERLLGRSVTHGCVRVGRDALRTIATRTRVGTPVFIF